MRYTKILVATTLALSALVLSLLVLSQARADAPGPDTVQQQLASPSSDLAARDPVTVNLWLMPDFEEKKVWVDGTVSSGHSIRVRDILSDTYHLKMLLPFSEVVSWIDSPWIEHHYFGLWEGSQITPSHQLTGAYELHLPGLDLQPEDALNVYLVSGIILTDTFLPHTITSTTQITSPASSTSAATGTLGITLGFTPTAALGTTPTTVLTGSYTLTGLELSPATGQFVVSPNVALTANYTLPAPAFSPTTDTITRTVISPTFSYTMVNVLGDYSVFKLYNFSQPVTLTLLFYPFEKAIDLTLTPLLVETTMTRTASAMGGAAVRRLHGADPIRYAQGGLLGRGDICLRIPTSADDPLRSAVALVAAFRRDYRQEGLNRLLERHLDFPSFPIAYSVGELNPHKETIIEVVTEEMSGTARSDASALTLQAPFQLNVWRALRMPRRRETLVVTSTSTPASDLIRGDQLYSNVPCAKESPNFDYASDIFELYDFPDFNRCIGGRGDKQVLQMGLGRVMLGPHDVLTLTIESVAWVSLDPLPNELKDYWQQGLGGPERSGFTAVYRGPRTFWLDIRYTPHPSLFARQSVATIRGRSRILEDRLGELWTDLVREPLRSTLLFTVSLESIGDLDERQVLERLTQEFSRTNPLSGTVRIETLETGERWRIRDGSRQYLVVKEENRSLRVSEPPLRREPLFSVGLNSIGDLNIGRMPEQLTQEFSRTNPLSGTVRIETLETGERWRIRDGSRQYLVVKEDQSLGVYELPLRRRLSFSVGLDSIGDLNIGRMPEQLTQEFSRTNPLSGTVRIEILETGKRWRIRDGSRQYLVVKEDQSLRVYLEHYNLKKEGWVSVGWSIVFLLIIWIPYQWTTPKRDEEGSEKKKSQDEQDPNHDSQITQWSLGRLGELRQNRIVHVLLRSCLVSLFSILGLMLENSFVGGILGPGSRPFAIAFACGALLLLRWEKGLLLAVVGGIGIGVDILLARQYTDYVQNALAYSSATGMLSGATSVAMLIITLAWVGVLFWWSQTKNPRFQLKHRDLHAFTFFGLAAAVFEVTDASLFALIVLFIAWFVFSLFLDKARCLDKPPEDEGKPNTQISPQPPSLPAGDKQAKAEPAEGEPKPSAQTQAQNPAAGGDEQTNGQSNEPPKGINEKLSQVRRPLFVLAILVVAVVLAQDPLLRTQLAPFTRSAPLELAWFMWVLDPLARLATTLVPCLAMVLLVVLLDAILERLRYRNTGKASSSQDTYVKILLSVPLFLIFMLGIGGLDLFTGALGLKLSDRIVYYVTIPLVTSIWLDLGKEGLKGLWNQITSRQIKVEQWIKIIITLISILVPWFASTSATKQVEQIIKTLQTLQF